MSAGESIRCLRWLLRDYSLSYVEGGMDQLAHALLRFCRRAAAILAPVAGGGDPSPSPAGDAHHLRAEDRKSGNGAISNGQVPGEVGRDRLPVDVPVPGLYLCGDGAGGRGIGTELAAESGMEAAEAIARDVLSRPTREAA